MEKIVISEFMDPTAVNGLKEDFAVVYDPGLVDQPGLLLAEIKTADAIIVRNRTQVRGDLLSCAKKLRVVGRLGVGLDNIDIDACRARQIEVFPACGTNGAAVAEYVIASVFILFRKAYQSTLEMIEGKWPRTALMGNETAGKILGLIGFGAIARETCTRAKAMGMTVIAHDPFLPPGHPAWKEAPSTEFEALLEKADVVSLHVPLTDKTRHLMDARAIARMKKGALLINTARGKVVDEKALIGAMASGHIGGAAVDVFENEPLTAGMGQRFKGVSNLLLTPHIAGVTIESNIRTSAVTADNVRNALAR
ncbi:MAG: hydroxyacid dehydrogenase [Proteobacteria bacterium]|nr:hydroxyacid dehydrogenase [Pseudomonadota bacterium]